VQHQCTILVTEVIAMAELWKHTSCAGGIREDQEMKDIYPLRLPRSLKKEVERLSRQDGTSMNQFVAIAVAEKVSALETAEYFADRRARANFKAFDKIMKRRGGKPPCQDDEIPK
jgi:hypothetical protein